MQIAAQDSFTFDIPEWSESHWVCIFSRHTVQDCSWMANHSHMVVSVGALKMWLLTLDRSKCLTGPTASSFETGKCACPIGATTLKIDCKSTQVWLSPHQKCTYNSIPESFLGTVHGTYSCNPTRKKDIAVPRSLHGGTEATTCLQAGVC